MERVSSAQRNLDRPSWASEGRAKKGRHTSTHTKCPGISPESTPERVRAKIELHYPLEQVEPVFDYHLGALESQSTEAHKKNPYSHPETHLTRVDALRALAFAEIFQNNGPTDLSDSYLERLATIITVKKPLARTVRQQTNKNLAFAEAHYLHSDERNRATSSTKESMIRLRTIIKSPRGVEQTPNTCNAPFSPSIQLDNLSAIAGNSMTAFQYIQTSMIERGIDTPESPEFLQFCAEAYFSYATTLEDGAEKTKALKNALAYSDKAYNRAQGATPSIIRVSARYIHARALHDVAFIDKSMDTDNPTEDTELRIEARRLAPYLIAQACEEFLIAGYSKTEARYAEMRYFESLYLKNLDDAGIDRSHNDEFNVSARRFMDTDTQTADEGTTEQLAKVIRLKRAKLVGASAVQYNFKQKPAA